jgi:3',5'-cyclic AMP phosphodiesterase CpdA
MTHDPPASATWTKILAVTDIHLTTPDETIIGLDTTQRLKETLAHACMHHPDAEAMILMGDLAHHGRADQYARLRAVTTNLSFPVIPMMGNHDRRDAFLSVFPDAPQTQSGHIQTVYETERHRIITLDTLDGPPYHKGHHSGFLCEERLAWLSQALEGLNGRIPLVFAHHPPFDTGIVGMDLIKLRNGQALLDTLSPHPDAHLFCGHIHRTISGSTQGTSWTMFKSPAHQGVLDLSTPDSALSVDEPPCYGVILLPPDGVIAHTQGVYTDQVITADAHSLNAQGPQVE